MVREGVVLGGSEGTSSGGSEEGHEDEGCHEGHGVRQGGVQEGTRASENTWVAK